MHQKMEEFAFSSIQMPTTPPHMNDQNGKLPFGIITKNNLSI
jgi:hypothetical protein